MAEILVTPFIGTSHHKPSLRSIPAVQQPLPAYNGVAAAQAAVIT